MNQNVNLEVHLKFDSNCVMNDIAIYHQKLFSIKSLVNPCLTPCVNFSKPYKNVIKCKIYAPPPGNPLPRFLDFQSVWPDYFGLFFSAFIDRLSKYDLEEGWFGNRLKDTTDMEWAIFSRNALYSIPYLILHFIGSQYLKKFNKGVSCLLSITPL